MIRHMLWGLVLTICTLGTTRATAQDAPALVEYYGDGVHAYFEGDIFEAHRLLTQAVDGGIQDPRAYYFRAMTLLRMGRQPEAEADMQAGAYLEARAPSGAYDVDRSIQRIQGRHRLLLEKIRRQVRFAVEQQRSEEESLRYEETRRREAEVLRRQRPQTYDEAVQPAGGPQGAQGTDASAAPEAREGAMPAETRLPQPGVAPPADVPQPPTAGAPAVEPQPGSGSVPSTTPAGPFDEPAAEQPDPAEDPFGGAFDEPEPDAAGEEDAPPAATDTGAGEPPIEVGQKVAGTKLLGVIGGLFGSAFDDTVDNVMGSIPGPGLGQPPFGPGAGPVGGEAGGDSFGGAGDPFGGEADPFGGSAAPAADDLFGGGAQNFGGDEQAVQPETGDPFGGSDSVADPSRPDGNEPDTDANPFGAGADPFN